MRRMRMRMRGLLPVLVVGVARGFGVARRVPHTKHSVISGRLSAAAALSDEESAARTRSKLDGEFATIALPALVQFAAEPLARLVDTAYVGRLGAAALGGAGAAVAVQYAFAKLSNDPLLRTSISLVAADEDGSASVAAALTLALVVGCAQGLLTLVTAPWLLSNLCAVGPGSPMRPHALGYVCTAAVGAPTATLWLVVNGIFRGLGDTRTPLIWALAFAGANAVLDPLLIFQCGLGAAGAAAATALSQTLALYPLLRSLKQKLNVSSVPSLFTVDARALRASLARYLSAGGFVLLRSLGKISAYSVCAREASKLGSVPAAAHNVCFQLGVATTQLCESAAVATQSLLARDALARRRPRDAKSGDRTPPMPMVQAWVRTRHILRRGLVVGAVVSSSLSLVTLLNKESVVAGLTTDPAVRAAAAAIMPSVMLCQTLKGLAYPINGALMGALDWKFASICMWLAQFACVGSLAFPRGQSVTLARLWRSLVALFAIQCLTGIARVLSQTGPWRDLFVQGDALTEDTEK